MRTHGRWYQQPPAHTSEQNAFPFAKNKSLRLFSKGAAKRRPLDECQGSGDLNLHFQTTLSLLREANSAQVIFYWFLVPGSPVFPESLRKRGKTIFLGFCFSVLLFLERRVVARQTRQVKASQGKAGSL